MDKALLLLGVCFFILIVLALYGSFKAFQTMPHFYLNGKELSYQAVDSIVQRRGPHYYANQDYPSIDLPEEYKNITHSTPIQGVYDSTSNTLTIEFKP